MTIRLEAIAIKDFAPFTAQKTVFGAAKGADGRAADVHIFVGENGTGKTRLLSLLMAACGNMTELKDRCPGKVEAMVVGKANDTTIVWNSSNSASKATSVDAAIHQYISAEKWGFNSHGQNLSAFDARFAAFGFKSVAAVRDEKLKPMALVDWGGGKETHLAFAARPNENVILGQALANMKIRAGMYLASAPDEDQDRTVRMTSRLEKTLERITGRPFVFVVEQEGNEVRLRVSWGRIRMRLQELPDGLRAIIGWLGSCVAKLDSLFPQVESPLDLPVVLFLDEPETNLHPAWQRHVVPALQHLLPNGQIFVATHSPFVVSSVNSGWVYILKANKDGQVEIDGPKPCSKGDSYIDAVEDVLGLKEWYDPETEELLREFREARDMAVKSFNEVDKAKMFDLAKQIAMRSESLEQVVGHELKQFDAKAKAGAA